MNRQILEEAAEWFIELSANDADHKTRKNFEAWLRKSPEHVRIYLEILPIWEDAALPLPSDGLNADELVARMRQRDNVLPFHQSREGRPGEADIPIAGFQQQKNRRWLAAATVMLVLGAVAWVQHGRAPAYATDIGERRAISLSDGSAMELNTRSRARVKFTDEVRSVELLEGQALFRVAKDSRRPFVVVSGATRVRAVGTQFDVYRKPTGTVVTVLDGRVAILDVRAAPAILAAGEQLTVAADAARKAARTNLDTAIAWTQGRLIFDSTPLPEVAEEFNRYNERPIVIDGSELQEFHVSGSFGSSDPKALLDFLKAQAGLTVQETDAAVHIK